MILAPQVLFLDEPTTGLDPRGRSEVWQSVRDMVAAGTSVLLTTQYLDEADQLADRISVINHGAVIAEGTPDQLKTTLGGDRIDVVLHATTDLARAAELIGKVAGAAAEVDQDTRQVTDRVTVLVDVAQTLKAAEIDIEDIALRRPTLDEVFLSLTAKEAA